MKVILLFPPVWDCDCPYPSLAYLSAVLKRNGYDVTVRDLNIELQDLITSEDWLERTVKELDRKISIENLSESNRRTVLKAIKLYEMVQKGSFAKAKDLLRSGKIDNIAQIVCAKLAIEHARFITSALYWPSYFTATNYCTTKPLNNIQNLLEEVYNIDTNIFYNILDTYVSPTLKDFDIIGLSFADVGQLVPGLTLAKIIKEKYPDKKVITGGAVIPYMVNALLNSPEIFKLIDGVIYGEGETPLTAWIDSVSRGIDLENVPNLIYSTASGEVKKTRVQSFENVDDLPTPDYSQYPFEKYFQPSRVITYISARGCPWNKCSFCSLTTNYGQVYRARKLDKVIDDIKKLTSTYGSRYLLFDDESIPSGRIKAISEAFTQNKMDLRWECLTRLDKGFNEELLKTAYNSGLRMLSFGFESGSQRVLDRMHKGTLLSDAVKVLTASKKVGIWNNLFIIFGFPGETEADVIETMRFACKHGNILDTINCGSFRAEGGSEVFRSPESFNIKIEKGDHKVFGPAYKYRYLDSTPNPVVSVRLFEQLTQEESYNSLHFFGMDAVRLQFRLSEIGKTKIRLELFESEARKKRCIGMLKSPFFEKVRILKPDTLQIHELYTKNNNVKEYLLRDSETGLTMVINQSSADILNYASNGIEIGILIGKFSQRYRIDHEKALKDVMEMISFYVESDFLKVCSMEA